MLKTCQECSAEFETQKKQKLYCNPKCSSRAYNRKHGLNSTPFKDCSTGTVGAIQELRVSVDLLSRGFEVFRALSPSCSCDILAMKDGKLYPIEVRTGYQTPTGKLYYPTSGKHKPTHFAIATKEKLFYLPELPA